MKHIKTTIQNLMDRARASRGYKEELSFFDDMPEHKVYLKDVDQYKVHKDFFTSNRQLRLHDRAVYNGSDPSIMGFAGDLCEVLRHQGLPFYVHTAYRSPAAQRALQAEGHSLIRSGPHQRGAAVDIVHSLYHWRVSADLWDFVGRTGKAIIQRRGYKISWGGDFKTLWDPAHWELSDWRSRHTVPIPSTVEPSLDNGYVGKDILRYTPASLRRQFGGVV